jgi:hypothetical protein
MATDTYRTIDAVWRIEQAGPLRRALFGAGAIAAASTSSGQASARRKLEHLAKSGA